MRAQPLLTVNEAAEFLKVHPRTIRRWIKSGKLQAHKLPGRGSQRIEYRIDEASLWAMLERPQLAE